MTDTDTDKATAVPAGRELHLGWALVLISVAQLMVVLDGTIVNIALPYIQQDLSIDSADLTWVVTGYALAFGSLLLLGGRLGDLYGRRKVFMIGLIIFAVASGLGGLATNEATLLAARGLQGLGAALASPAALALIATTFPAGPARNRAFAVYAAMSGAGAAVGLLLGGWLTGLDALPVEGWRLTLLINLPIGIGAALLAPRFLPESESHPGELDLPGAATGTLGLLGLVYGFSRAGSDGWSDSWTIASLVAGVAMLTAFLLVERRAEHPLLPFRVFTHRTRAASFVAMFLAPAAMFAMFYFLSQYIQNVMGYSPIEAGLAFLPFCAGIVVAAGVTSNLINRIDPRFLAGGGTLLSVVALYGFSRLPYDTTFPASEVSGTSVWKARMHAPSAIANPTWASRFPPNNWSTLVGDRRTESASRASLSFASAHRRNFGTASTTMAATTTTAIVMSAIVATPLRSSVSSSTPKSRSDQKNRVRNSPIWTMKPETESIAPADTAAVGGTPNRSKNRMLMAIRAAVLGIARLT